MIDGADYFVRLIDFPDGVPCNGMLLLNEDGTFSVYINAKASPEAQKKALRHELRHMAREDMFGDRSILACEEDLSPAAG